jgi:hypothetical protein
MHFSFLTFSHSVVKEKFKVSRSIVIASMSVQWHNFGSLRHIAQLSEPLVKIGVFSRSSAADSLCRPSPPPVAPHLSRATASDTLSLHKSFKRATPVSIVTMRLCQFHWEVQVWKKTRVCDVTVMRVMRSHLRACGSDTQRLIHSAARVKSA